MTRKIILIASLILFFVNVPAFAEDDVDTQYTIATLRGIKRVYVIVRIMDLSPIALKEHGLTVDQIRTDTEIKLRTAGIKIIPTEVEVLKEPGSPTLQVLINSIYEPVLKGFLIHISVELFQLVRLERAPSVLDVPATWGKAKMTLIEEEHVQNIRDIVKDCVDKFINAYLTANPKK